MGQARTRDNSLFDNQTTTRLVSRHELAEILGVSYRTITRLLKEGLGENSGVLVGSVWRFNVAKAWDWLSKRGS